MKAENFEQVKELMQEREKLKGMRQLVQQSDGVTFSKGGTGRIDFEIELNIFFNTIEGFKDEMLRIIKEEIKAIDDKLKDL
ncbi:MAG TPA: hypothetical protein VK175_06095 [Leadbetterella sp.]|nr:hypothetical protein [Leadbetterella sp.]